MCDKKEGERMTETEKCLMFNVWQKKRGTKNDQDWKMFNVWLEKGGERMHERETKRERIHMVPFLFKVNTTCCFQKTTCCFVESLTCCFCGSVVWLGTKSDYTSQIDSGPLQASPDDSGRISDFFPDKKDAFLGGLQIIKIPIVETDFMQKYTNSIRDFEPFGFNDRMQFHSK